MITIHLEYHSGIPVYKQMTDAIIAAVHAGELRIGDKLPPIRKLSEELGINPNTTARVYRELELIGIVESVTGSGCFVLPQAKVAPTTAQKKAKMQDIFSKLLREAQSFQINERELLSYMTARMKS